MKPLPGACLLAVGLLSLAAPAEALNYGRFLPPDQAFRLSARARPGAVALSWRIADGYYLYRKRFKVVAETGGIGTVDFPAGEIKDDPNFGRVVVYRHQVTLQIPVAQRPADGRMKLAVTYQGCADAGLCYTPITKHLAVDLPAASGGVASSAGRPQAPPATGPPAAQDRLAALVERSNPGWFALVFFGLGVLLAFTPCVLPMIPILAGVIGGAGTKLTTRRAFLLSLAYVLAMACVYTAAGVAAGFAGAGLQAFFQAPWVIAVFAAVFVALAAALFGLYELRLPSAVQNRITALSVGRRGGTWFGAAALGALSALIVSPCVAAPLAGALIVIGQAGEPFRGGIALAALSLGMGAPLLVFGTVAGRLLPKAGAWMETLERLLGVVLLAFAVWLLGRIIPAPGTLVLWGLVGILASVFLGVFERADPSIGAARRLVRALGLGAFAWALMLLVGGAAGGVDPLRPLAVFTGGSSPAARPLPTLSYQAVNSVPELQGSLARAAAMHRPVMVDFYADWCTSCHEMDRTTFRDPAVRALLSQMQVLRVDVTRNTAADRDLLRRYGLYGPPAYLFFDANGRYLADDAVVGFLAAPRFLARARRALNPSRAGSAE